MALLPLLKLTAKEEGKQINSRNAKENNTISYKCSNIIDLLSIPGDVASSITLLPPPSDSFGRNHRIGMYL